MSIMSMKFVKKTEEDTARVEYLRLVFTNDRVIIRNTELANYDLQ